ncbi:LysR substrate-binding domain-containing protein [Pelagibius sp.]|uniref:LysR substrate-binding domain-containing protein n=1 Tax=Pelagibius sp. TaxID=1931238 RepID=UPI002603A44B|nr:LysR substrate-binding domain-containing protein [Pelagibius sp.]
MDANSQPPAQAEPAEEIEETGAAKVPPLAGPRRAVPSISGLIAFEASARHLSFSYAARELTLTQGAVSKRVRQLEHVLGVSLLARSRRKVVLTEHGERYLIHARRVLGEIQAAAQSLRADNEGASITLAVPPEIANYWLMPRLGDFHACHPDVAVNLVSWRPTEDAARPGGFECAIYCVEDLSACVSAVVLFAEELLPVATPRFLAANPIAMPSALLGMPLIQQSSRHGLWRDWFAALGLDSDGRLDGSSHDCLSLVIEAALNDHGVALAPVHAVRDLLDRGRLHAIFDAPIATDRSYVFAVHPAFVEQIAVRQFRHWIAQTAETSL